ncbi:MAG: hypothetical protein ACI814_002420 [Mariniblastus sp.]|jgi:hypothetical protein
MAPPRTLGKNQFYGSGRLNMAFFKPTANLPDEDKARIEFHLQQIAESIGFDRFSLPVLSAQDILYGAGGTLAVEGIKHTVGQHLHHDVGTLTIKTELTELEKCGGGG